MYYVATIAVGAVIMQFLLLPLYIRMKRKKYNQKLRVVVKGTVTLVAVVFCIAGIFKIYEQTGDLTNLTTSTGFKTNILVLLGLIICMIADMVLSVNFAIGMVVFLLGHICYVSYFLSLAPFNLISIPLFLIPAIIAAKFFGKYSEQMGKLKFAFYIYGSFILITFSIGIMLPFSLGAYGVLPAIAAVLLVISDYMLAINTIMKRKVLADLLYLGYYFTGQFVMAISVFAPAYLNL